MLQYVHHVDYVVRNRDEMVAYIERNFGMKPAKLGSDARGHTKEAYYRVGQTLLRIKEPLRGSNLTQLLEKNGPGVDHVAWGVENMSGVAQALKAKGVTLRDEQGYRRSGQGYNSLNIDPKDSLGVDFQLIEQLE